MKQKELELLLQKVPSYKEPIPNLEQYITPADIAADVLSIAYQFGDIENKTILDLGCGTGIFSVGASLLGAKKIIGIDVDEKCIKIAKKYAEENNLKITFLKKDVSKVDIKCDTVIMNPPFGAQKGNKNADRKFIEKGFECSNVLYSLHLSKTVPFLEKMISSLSGEIAYYKDYNFPIKNTYDFHEKRYINFDVTLLRVLTKK